MENEEVVTAIHEMAEFAAMTGRTLENHKGVLARHESILEAEYRAGVSHHDAIQTLRAEVQTLGQQISTLQHSVIKNLRSLGPAHTERLASQRGQLNIGGRT